MGNLELLGHLTAADGDVAQDGPRDGDGVLVVDHLSDGSGRLLGLPLCVLAGDSEVPSEHAAVGVYLVDRVPQAFAVNIPPRGDVASERGGLRDHDVVLRGRRSRRAPVRVAGPVAAVVPAAHTSCQSGGRDRARRFEEPPPRGVVISHTKAPVYASNYNY
jgi:hypothetical protein